MQILHEDAFHRVEADPSARLLKVTRSAEPFPSIEHAEAAFEALVSTVGKHDLRDHALLVDSRLAIGRNDASFESLVTKRRTQFFGRFERRAILMRTVAGKLQAQRMERDAGDAFHLEVFTDEESALAYLRAGR